MVELSVDFKSKKLDNSTSKVFLRPLARDDASLEYLSWIQNTELTKFLSLDPLPLSVDDLALYIAQIQESPSDFLFGIFEKVNGRHIGNIKLGGINWTHSYGDVGILLGNSNYHGGGYASDALILLCDFAFRELNIQKLIAGVHDENFASSNLFTKTGFTLDGIQTLQFVDRSGKRFNRLLFGLLKS
jgi:ribosomal-protein-alanine N-acetyltransferase